MSNTLISKHTVCIKVLFEDDREMQDAVFDKGMSKSNNQERRAEKETLKGGLLVTMLDSWGKPVPRGHNNSDRDFVARV